MTLPRESGRGFSRPYGTFTVTVAELRPYRFVVSSV